MSSLWHKQDGDGVSAAVERCVPGAQLSPRGAPHLEAVGSFFSKDNLPPPPALRFPGCWPTESVVSVLGTSGGASERIRGVAL